MLRGDEWHSFVSVCPSFWRDTFAISRQTFDVLAHHAGDICLPKYLHKGSHKSGMEASVRSYVASIPRYFSHYSPTSTSEYVACASSALNWWKGDLEYNPDGTRPLCLLEWLDMENNTEHYKFYKLYDYFPGVVGTSESRPRPYKLSLPDSPAIPKPAVPYIYFLNLVQKWDLQFKDQSPDQCAKCMQFICKLQKAVGGEAARIRTEFEQHKRQGDIGYAYRKQRKKESKAMWIGTTLPIRGVVSFPPPPAPVCIGANSDKYEGGH
jgi:hypothetical protein